MFSHSNSMKRFILGASIALSFAFGASAQQSSGNIAGTAVTGDTVVIHSKDTGWHRELNIKRDGKFHVRWVPTGEYVVTVTHADGKSEPRKLVIVRIGTTTRVK